MTVDEAIKAVDGLNSGIGVDAAARMKAAVLRLGRVPVWVENEIVFSRVRTPCLTGNMSGGASLCEDIRYHGGVCDGADMLTERYEKLNED